MRPSGLMKTKAKPVAGNSAYDNGRTGTNPILLNGWYDAAALGVALAYSTQFSNYYGECAFDGNEEPGSGAGQTRQYVANGGSVGTFLSIDLGVVPGQMRLPLIERVRARGYDAPDPYNVDCSDDNSNWRTIKSFSGNFNDAYIPPTRARYWRLITTGHPGGGTFQVGAFRLYTRVP